MEVSRTGGMKGSKEARFDLIPPRPLEQLAILYGRGANKYAERNWERGYNWSLSFSALQRHAWAFWKGQDDDIEMRVPHLTCVAFHAFSITEFMFDHPDAPESRHQFDDRPPRIWTPHHGR